MLQTRLLLRFVVHLALPVAVLATASRFLLPAPAYIAPRASTRLASPAALAAQPGALPVPPLEAEIGGRLRAVASDGRFAYVALHSRMLVVDPASKAGGKPRAVGTAVGAPITALAARPGWLLALADGLHVFALDSSGATPPRLVAQHNLPRPAQDVAWIGDQAWLRSRDVVQRIDLTDPRQPRTLSTWRPRQPSADHAAPFVRELAPFAGGALLLLSSNANDPDGDMLGEAMQLRPEGAGEPIVVDRVALAQCCPDRAVVRIEDAADPAQRSARAILVGWRTKAWWLELDPPIAGEPARLRTEPLTLPEGLNAPTDLAWTSAGLWWTDGTTLRLVDPTDEGIQSPTLRLPTSSRRAAVHLQSVGLRVLVAMDEHLRWADSAPRLLPGPEVAAWPIAQLALGADTLWLRGEDLDLRWTSLVAPESVRLPTGDVPRPISDLAADGQRVYSVHFDSIRYHRHEGDRHLIKQRMILPHNLVEGRYDAPRLLDAADGLLAATVDDDRDRVVRMDAATSGEGHLFEYHGPGPLAAALEGERLHVLCASRFGGPCTLRTHDLRDRSGALDPAELPLTAGTAIAPTIGHAGELVMLGIGSDVVLVRVPREAGAASIPLGQLDLPGPVLEIAMDEGVPGPTGNPTPAGAAWILSDGGRYLSWVDLSDPAAPREIARATVAGNATSLRARDGRAWLVADGAVQVYGRPDPGTGTDGPRLDPPLSLPWLSSAR